MTDEEFNKYCAEVFDYADPRLVCGDYGDFEPATDLNQMAEVFDKLWAENYRPYTFAELVSEKGIAKAMREFIESTAP